MATISTPSASEFEPAPADARLTNSDLAPTTAAQRKWSVWSYAALWVSMSACIPTYTLASGMVAQGMNWWQAVATIFAGSAVVLIPMVLNGFAGTRHGIPFPVYCRASFGTAGANLPAMVRAVIACGWFGIQTWIGGTAVLAIAVVFKPEWGNAAVYPVTAVGITVPQLVAFLAFWAVNMAVIFAGIDSIRILLDIKAPLLVALGLLLLGWAGHTYGFGSTFHKPSKFTTPRAFWTAFFPLVTGVVGFWATVSLNIPDFTRYAKRQRDQVLGQAIGLPFTMALYAFIGIAVTLATGVTDPIELVSTFHNRWVVVLAEAAIVLATLATNIAANVVSPANDFANLAPRFIGFRLGGLLTGLVGICIMPWKLYADPHGYIFTWLIGSSSLLGAVGGVLIADYWVLRRATLDVAGLYREAGPFRYDRGVNWVAVLAVVVAVLPCVPGFVDQLTGGGLLRADRLAGTIVRDVYQYAWFFTFAVAGLTYLVLMAGTGNAATNDTNGH
jgi:NCS1 family nucleobase:cation symporter-1